MEKISQGDLNPPLYQHDTPPEKALLRPYLGLRARASLAWTNHVVLLLLLTLVQLILSSAAIDDGVRDAKANLAASCAGVESAASAAASMPHFMATQLNAQLADGAENMVRGLGEMLDLSIQGIEAITIFMVDTYRSMFLCLSEFVVRGSLSLLISATQEAEQAVTSTFAGIRTGIQDSIGGVESLINSTLDKINKLPGVDIPLPTLSIPSLDALSNVTLPTDLSGALTKLNGSLPDLADLKQQLDQIISVPFEELRSEINGTMSNMTINRSLFAVPQRQTVTFCQDLDTSFIDDIGNLIQFGLRIMIGLIVATIALVIAFNILKEKFHHSRMIARLTAARKRWLVEGSLSNEALLAFTNELSSPLLAFIATRCLPENASLGRRNRSFWVTSYLLWPPALLFLTLGLLGLFAVEVQLTALSIVQHRAVDRANGEVQQLGSLITQKINAQTGNASATFANDGNAVILGFQDSVNTQMFGWANTTTTTLNDSLTTFYDGLTSVVDQTFGSTPLAAPAQELINCLIGQKIAGIQKGLTFIHDHAHLTLPTIDPNILMLNQGQTQELVADLADPGSRGGDDDRPVGIGAGFVEKLVHRYRQSLLKQRIAYLVLIGTYLLVVSAAVAAMLWDMRCTSTPTKERGLNDVGSEDVLPRKRVSLRTLIVTKTKGMAAAIRGPSSQKLKPLQMCTFGRSVVTKEEPPPSPSNSPALPTRRRTPHTSTTANSSLPFPQSEQMHPHHRQLSGHISRVSRPPTPPFTAAARDFSRLSQAYPASQHHAAETRSHDALDA